MDIPLSARFYVCSLRFKEISSDDYIFIYMIKNNSS